MGREENSAENGEEHEEVGDDRGDAIVRSLRRPTIRSREKLYG